jgi:hypothetical protein
VLGSELVLYGRWAAGGAGGVAINNPNRGGRGPLCKIPGGF